MFLRLLWDIPCYSYCTVKNGHETTSSCCNFSKNSKCYLIAACYFTICDMNQKSEASYISLVFFVLTNQCWVDIIIAELNSAGCWNNITSELKLPMQSCYISYKCITATIFYSLGNYKWHALQPFTYTVVFDMRIWK